MTNYIPDKDFIIKKYIFSTPQNRDFNYKILTRKKFKALINLNEVQIKAIKCAKNREDEEDSSDSGGEEHEEHDKIVVKSPKSPSSRTVPSFLPKKSMSKESITMNLFDFNDGVNILILFIKQNVEINDEFFYFLL